ncbi:hypothetical protein ACH42_05370 [Endozoicomonas sp. (ex Bugula neritina AB1)]|nr:hypothetical protein ACH42_05370 [Endozoicomonas sp. (ex Bugula neritina AB1)]
MRSFILAAILLVISTMPVLGMANESPIRADSPASYTVRKGDTLWNISNTFLKSPWLWPEIWHANPQIHNPHLIFPGDLVSLVYINGRPRLTVVSRGDSGRTVKLSPKVRKLPAESAIPAIPLSAISAYLNKSRIFSSSEELEKAPYVFASKDGRTASSTGDRIYGRGFFPDQVNMYGVYREKMTLIDPISGENLGIIGEEIATLNVKKITDDVATLMIKESKRAVKTGDRLISEEPFSLVTTFFPRAPDAPIDGAIIANLSGSKKAARFDTVVINRGQRQSLRQGDILAIYKTMQVTDSISNELVILPPERVGLVMVYRPFDKLSYGIVLSASEDIEAGDLLKSP